MPWSSATYSSNQHHVMDREEVPVYFSNYDQYREKIDGHTKYDVTLNFCHTVCVYQTGMSTMSMIVEDVPVFIVVRHIFVVRTTEISFIQKF